MTDKQKKMIVLCKHSEGIMKDVFYNIYLFLTGKIQKTNLDFYCGYIDSKCRHIYTMVNGEIIETVYNPDGKKVYTGVYQ